MRPPALIAIVVIGIAVAGCSRKAPVYEVSSAPIVTLSKPLTTAQVRRAIIEAGTDKGWIVKENEPGRILLETFFRSHSAVVAVDYSSTTYDITYQDSTNLDYDGSNIHRNYNKMIMVLRKEINLQLSKSDI